MITALCTDCKKIPQYSRGLCRACYQRAWRARTMPIRRIHQQRLCGIPGCERAYAEGGYCHMHAQRVRRHGDATIVLKPGRKPAAKRSA